MNQRVVESGAITLEKNLVLLLLEAGGPGSGRHSEGNKKPVNTFLHFWLTKNGYEHTKNTKGGGRKWSEYTHNSGSNISVNKYGSWSHTSTKGEVTDGKYTPGDYGISPPNISPEDHFFSTIKVPNSLLHRPM